MYVSKYFKVIKYTNSEQENRYAECICSSNIFRFIRMTTQYINFFRCAYCNTQGTFYSYRRCVPVKTIEI